MSLNINVNVNVNLPLDVVCAIRNNVNATDLEPYSDLISKTATAVMKEIKSLPYDIKPTSTTKNDAQTTTISFTVLRYNNGSRLQINDFESNTKVSRLFRRVHVDTGLPVDQTRFIFNRQQIRGYGLEDDDSNEETLGLLGIIDGSVVHLFPSFRGSQKFCELRVFAGPLDEVRDIPPGAPQLFDLYD